MPSVTSRGPAWLWDLIGLAARLLLAGVFLVSGYIKAVDPAQTRVAVRAYQLLPEGLVEPVAAVLPYLEIAAGLLLLLGLATRLGAILSALMMVGFLIGVISAAARGLNIDCGCFGGGGAVAAGETEYTAEILRDAGLLIVSVYLIARPYSWLAIDRLAHRDRGGEETDGDDVGGPAPDAAGTAARGRQQQGQ